MKEYVELDRNIGLVFPGPSSGRLWPWNQIYYELWEYRSQKKKTLQASEGQHKFDSRPSYDELSLCWEHQVGRS